MRHPGPGTRCPVFHPGTGGVAGGVSAVAAALDALLSPVGHLTMHHQHPFTRPPPAGSSRGRTVRRVPRVRYVTVSNCLVVLTNTEPKTRYRERDRGTAGQRTGESGARRGTRRAPGAEGPHWRWSGSSGTTTPTPGGRPSPSRSLPRRRRHTLHAAPSPPSRRHR